jgi:AbiV family abortive infection protein
MAKRKGSKSFMSLSKSECLVAYKNLLHNADEVYSDALTLAEKSSYGRATSLLILSMEETMKAYVLHLDGNGFQFRLKVKGISNLFNNHTLRYPLAMMLSIMHIFIKDFKRILTKARENPHEILKNKIDKKHMNQKLIEYLVRKLPVVITEIVWFSQAEIYRQKGFYVDYVDGLETPLSVNKEQYEDIKLRIDSLREISSSFWDVFDIKDTEYQKQIIALKQRFVEEDWYGRIGDLIGKFRAQESNPLIELSLVMGDFLKHLQETKSLNKALKL